MAALAEASGSVVVEVCVWDDDCFLQPRRERLVRISAKLRAARLIEPLATIITFPATSDVESAPDPFGLAFDTRGCSLWCVTLAVRTNLIFGLAIDAETRTGLSRRLLRSLALSSDALIASNDLCDEGARLPKA